MGAAGRLPHGRDRHRRPTPTARRSPCRSTAGRSSCGASTGSRTTCSSPGSPASGSPNGCGQADRRRRQPAPGLGRRPVRERGLLRPRRRVRPHGRAGLPVRLRRLPGGGAARVGGRGGGGRAGRPADAAPEPGLVGAATTRTSGATTTGAGPSSSATAPGAPATTSTCCRAIGRASSTRPGRTGRAARTRGSRDVHPNDPAHGTMHIWDVWNTDDYRKYRRVPAAVRGRVRVPGAAHLRHAAPVGLRRPAGARLARRAAPPEGRTTATASSRAGCAGHFPEPATFDDWHWVTQLNQARALTFGIEHFRSLRPQCMGTIVWQLNDCWPVTSWAAVDGDGRRKPLWYALRRSYADRLITFQPQPENGLAVVLVNDGTHRLVGTLRRGSMWLRRQTAGPVRRRGRGAGGRCAPRPAARRRARRRPTRRPNFCWPTPTTADARGHLVLRRGRRPRVSGAGVQTTVVETDGGLRVEVTAATLLRDLTLFPDRLDPAASLGARRRRADHPAARGAGRLRGPLPPRPIDRDAAGGPPRPPVRQRPPDPVEPGGESALFVT